MATPSTRHIFGRYDAWSTYSEDSWARGQEALEFTVKGEQWKQNRPEGRDSLVFNLAKKTLLTQQANSKNLDLAIDVFSVENKADIKEERAFHALMTHIMLTGNNRISLNNDLQNLYAFGQSIFLLQVAKESQTTLNKGIYIKLLNDPRRAFFDTTSASTTRHDGMFCGYKSVVSRTKAIETYGKKFDFPQSDVEIIDFYYKKKEKATFVELENGQYKREDLITDIDRVVIGPSKSSHIYRVYHMQVAKDVDVPLLKPYCMGIDILPMVYNDGFTSWTGESYESFPSTYDLQDAQRLLNYAGSQLGDYAKTATADKWFIDKRRMQSERARNAASRINLIDGVVPLDTPKTTANLEPIQRMAPSQASPTLVQLFGESQTLLNSLAGSLFDGNNGEVTAISGVAIDKLVKRMDLVQSNAIVAHEKCVNIVGEIVKQLIPQVYTEHRVLALEQLQGEIQTLEINEPISYETPNQIIGKKLKNNVRAFVSQYGYKINAVASSELQSQNTFVILTNLYKIYPAAIQSTLDIYLKSFDIKEASVLSRRLGVQVPKPVVDYGNGTITFAQYEEEMQQAQQQQMQMQQQMTNSTPEAQWNLANAAKAEAQAKKLEVETVGESQKTQLENEKLNLDVERALLSRFNAVTARMNVHVNQNKADQDAALATNQQQVDILRDVLQHENANLKAQK